MEAVYFTRFRVRPDDREPVVEAHRAWSSACREHRDFRAGLLVALEDGEWLEISVWRQSAPPDECAGQRMPPLDFTDRIDRLGTEILGQESGLLASRDIRLDRSDARPAESSRPPR